MHQIGHIPYLKNGKVRKQVCLAVYVDDARNKFGRMTMCHMIADSTEELLTMADRIGVQRKWLQSLGGHREHMDICQSKRRLAIAYGAEPVSRKELARILMQRRICVE